MTGTILHKSTPVTSENTEKNPFLLALGERVRSQRSRRGLTRKSLAVAAGVSERHLANLEYGVGNASILVLNQVAEALGCSLAELHGDVTTQHPEWLLLRQLLSRADEAQIGRVRHHIASLLGADPAYSTGGKPLKRSTKIALIGLRGAGKSTLGRLLAQRLDLPFYEVSQEIEKLAGASVAEIQALYGMNAYRRHERRVIEHLTAQTEAAVIATPGGLVSDVSSFDLVLTHCTTVWLQADPADHMQRVRQQGDTRPMTASREAMQDLQGILASREPFYSKADFTINTSKQGIEASLALLQGMLSGVLL